MSHCNTVLSQLLKMVGRHEFDKVASAHHEGQRLRKTNRWSQFVALVFGQLSGRQSLRDIESNLNAQRQYSYHLGGAPITRSSLARLNNQQPASCYETLFYKLYDRCAKHAPKHGFRFKNPLYALDASLIDLSLKLFPWSHYALGKGAMKLTVGLDLRGNIPAFATLTESKKADSECAKLLTLPKGSIVVCDRGYNDYGWYKSLTANGIFYVTRQRSNATYDVVERRSALGNPAVVSDSVIRYNSLRSQKSNCLTSGKWSIMMPRPKRNTLSLLTTSSCRRRPSQISTSNVGRSSCSLSGSSRTSRSSPSSALARTR